MKILESRAISTVGPAKEYFIRIDPEDISSTLSAIHQALMDFSWLKNFDEEYMVQSYQQRAQITINHIKKNFDECSEEKLTKDAGEYVVSELSREAIVSDLGYLDIPLSELLGKKISGNPGFDFHSQNCSTDTVIFGEAKYISAKSAYLSAIKQINEFIAVRKDISDIADLDRFCTPQSLRRASNGVKGFAAAFSAKSTPSNRLIQTIQARSEYAELLKYEEIILVAVNL